MPESLFSSSPILVKPFRDSSHSLLFFLHSYSQCIPSRFKKDIVRAAKDAESEHVAIEGLEKVISNIGASQKVSRNDMEVIFSEIGESGRISTEKMFKLL